MIFKNRLFSLLAILLLVMTNSQAAQTFRLGSGDVVRITVFEHPDLSTVARVAENGSISVPFVGELDVAGLTERQTAIRIADMLSAKDVVKSPQVSVIIDTYQSQTVAILGEVVKPGIYPVTRGTTVIDVLAEAGGLTQEAGDTVIVNRKGRAPNRVVLELTPILSGGDVTKNAYLADGDKIFVPTSDKFHIYGEVNKPGAYRLEKGMTVVEALSVAGGLTGKGTERGITIKRKLEPEGEMSSIRVDLSHHVKSGDVIYIKESLF